MEKTSRQLDLRVKFRRAVWAAKINGRAVGILMAVKVKTLGEITEGVSGDRKKDPRLHPGMLPLRGGGEEGESAERQGRSSAEEQGKPSDRVVIKEKGRPPVPAATNRPALISV